MSGRTGHTDTRLLSAVLTEVGELRRRVDGMTRVLAPAFSPPSPSPRRDSVTRGPGDHRPEPYIQRQASSRSDPWAGDLEHQPAYVEAIKNGTPIGELRRQSAQAAAMEAARQPDPAMWRLRDGSLLMDGSVRRAPEQSSVVKHQWNEFPDHSPGLPYRADRGEPGFLTARQSAPQVPGRPEGTIVRGPGGE